VSQAIEELIAAGESQRVEFKSEIGDGIAIAWEVCALLNANGGVVVIGVANRGMFTDGVTPGDAERLERTLREKISPAAMFSVAMETVGGHQLISVEVPSGPEKPYVCGNRIFVRVGSQTVAAVPQAAADLVSKRQPTANRWERRKALGLTLADLDADLIRKTVTDARRRGYAFRAPDDVDTCLEDLGLLRDGQLTNGADVLFGNRVAMRLPQTRGRALTFETNRASDHIDERIFEGPAPHLLEELVNFARRHVEVRGEFRDDRLERTTRPRAPFGALREAFVNALVHRDYSAFSGGIALRIYPGRIEIWNSGAFPPGYRISDLKRPEHPSVLVNPDISMVFYLLGLMERTGRGAYTIIRECVDVGLTEPKWNTNGSGVLLTLDGSPRPAFRLNADHREILAALREGDSTRASDWSMSERTSRRRLSELVDAGYLVREGQGPASRYVRTAKPAEPGGTRRRITL
jgi:ATP-dependent DNA helicase RecG